MPLLPSECPNCGRMHQGHDFNADPGPAQARARELEAVIAHVIRYGKQGKQSERRLRAALRGDS